MTVPGVRRIARAVAGSVLPDDRAAALNAGSASPGCSGPVLGCPWTATCTATPAIGASAVTGTSTARLGLREGDEEADQQPAGRRPGHAR